MRETRAAAGGVREYVSAGSSLVALLGRAASEHGEQVAFIDDQRSTTWRQFASLVDDFAHRLAAVGVGMGDRVALLFANGIPFTAALWAIWRVGAIAVPLNSRLMPSELGVLLESAEPRLLLGGRGFEDTAMQLGRMASCEVFTESGDGRVLAEVAPAKSLATEAVDASTIVALMYTSGTTGRPKGVIIRNRNAMQNSRTCIDVIGRQRGDVELIQSVQSNITGLYSQTVPVVDAALTAVLVPRFEPRLVLDLMERHRVTSTVAAPTMWWKLLEDETFAERDLSSMRLVLYGGAPMPTALLERLRAAFPHAGFGNGYGMTETCSMVSYIGGSEVFAHPGSVGRPLPITDVRVVEPLTGEDLPRGMVGELWFRGPQVSSGYWRDDDGTDALIANGWIRTGDAGSIDDDGFLHLADRLKDVIKRGGESVYCVEVEDVLAQHADVFEAAVVGVPDVVYGEVVKAVVVPKPGLALQEDELTAFCHGRLAHFKCPSIFEFRRELPRNAGGKVIKAQLRTRYGDICP